MTDLGRNVQAYLEVAAGVFGGRICFQAARYQRLGICRYHRRSEKIDLSWRFMRLVWSPWRTVMRVFPASRLWLN